LRFLTPVNPSVGENGEFVQTGKSIPATQRPPKKNQNVTNTTNTHTSTNTTNTTNTNTNTRPNRGPNPNKGGAKKSQGQSQDHGTTHNQTKVHNSSSSSQGETNSPSVQKKKVQVTKTATQNKGKATGQNPVQKTQQKNSPGQAQKNQARNKGKYQLKSHPDQHDSKTTHEEDILHQSPPLTYYEVTVKNTTTNDIVLTLLRRQDELDKPILLHQEITF